MAYCKTCGNEIHEQAVICVNCGAPTGVPLNPNAGAGGAMPDVMTGGLVALCILIPLAGIIVGAVRKSNGQVVSGGKCIKYSIIAWAVAIVLSGVSYGIALSAFL